MPLNESVLKMTLNADNRETFKTLILADAFKARSEKIIADFKKVIEDAAELTWGKTPQARAATKKLLSKVLADQKKLADREVSGFKVPEHKYPKLEIVIGGMRFNCVYDSIPANKKCIVNFDEHLLYNRHSDVNYESTVNAAKGSINLPADHPIAKRLLAIKDECAELNSAAEELTAIINTVFGKSRNLGSAIEKWEGLEHYVPMILSSCREMVVAGPVIDKKIKALREAKVPVKKAMEAA